jgi:anti-anti-sigma factor
MNITKTVNEGETILAVEGWLDTQAAPEMHAALDELGEDTENLVLDFSALEYISSSGVREVVAAYKKMNGALTVKNASAGIMSIFKATGIDKKIKFE